MRGAHDSVPIRDMISANAWSRPEWRASLPVGFFADLREASSLDLVAG